MLKHDIFLESLSCVIDDDDGGDNDDGNDDDMADKDDAESRELASRYSYLLFDSINSALLSLK